tara:strand:- start:1927 stop:2397 length:471 start_codon:yes stop_codon:yes gene_type:complete
MAATTKPYTQQAGGQRIYSFDFPYLKTEDVKVSLDGTNTTAFTLNTATSIQLNSAPSVGVKILIYRNTDVDTAQAIFSSGSSYRATDLNNNFDQILYFSQEVADSDNPLISNSSDFILDQSAKADGSVIYYSSSASKFKADTTQTLSTIVDGGSFN